MANLTNAKIANTFKDLLQVNAATSNSGLDDTVRQVQDGGGTAGPFGLSNTRLDVTGQFALNGTVLTATANQINELVQGSLFENITSENDTVLITRNGTSVSTATVSASLKVNPELSISSVIASTGSFLTKVSGAAAEFSGDVSANNVFAATNIFIAGSAIPTGESVASVSSRITSVGTVLAATSAALAASIANVSSTMATSINTANTRITSVSDFAVALSGTLAASIANVSSTMATSIGTTNTRIAQTSTDLATSIGTTNTRIAQTSTDLATSIANVSSTMATSINTANTRITSVSDFAVALSGTLAASIANVSSTMATSIDTANTRITSVSDFAVALSGTLAASIANVSSTMATSINTANARITSVSDYVVAVSNTLATSIGTTNTRIAQTSTDLATSIGTRLPLAGGTLTGILSGTDVYVSALAVGTNSLLGKDIHIEKSAVADIQGLTDGTNIAVDFNAGQNFTVTLGGNRTLDNPTNCVAGQVGSIIIVQDGTGSRTLAYGGNWDFISGTAPTLSTDADAIDRLDYIVHTSTDVQAILTKAYS